MHPTTYQHIYLRIDLHIYPSVHPSTYLDHIYIRLCIYFPIYTSKSLRIYLWIFLSIHLSYLSTHLSIHPSIYLPTINKQSYQDIYFFTLLSRSWAEQTMSLTIRAPAVPAAAVFDGGGTGKLHPRKECRAWSQLHTFSIELLRQCHLHRLIGKCRTISWQTGTLVEI